MSYTRLPIAGNRDDDPPRYFNAPPPDPKDNRDLHRMKGRKVSAKDAEMEMLPEDEYKVSISLNQCKRKTTNV